MKKLQSFKLKLSKFLSLRSVNFKVVYLIPFLMFHKNSLCFKVTNWLWYSSSSSSFLSVWYTAYKIELRSENM